MRILSAIILVAGAAIAQQNNGVVPLTAVIVTQSQLIRPDGISIGNTTQKFYYRDGAGRTRTQQGNRVTIFDPVAKKTIILDLAKQTAFVASAAAPPQSGSRQSTMVGVASAGIPPFRGPAPQQKPIVKLGQTTISGVTAAGYRSEMILPPGSAGNIQPMRHVSELWHSAALGIPVETSTTDSEILITGDRMAKQVTETWQSIDSSVNLDPSLFAVPAGFTVTGAASGN